MNMCLHRNLGIGHSNPMELTTMALLSVAEIRVEANTHLMSRVCPLGLEVLGGGDNRNAVNSSPAQQFCSKSKSECGLSRTRCCCSEKILGFILEVGV